MRTFVFAFAALSAAAVATPVMAQSDAMTYCKADIARLCAGIAPRRRQIMACLKAHSKEMSVGCAQALQKMKAG
ncbi:MAG TPA: cysteine rich repeat-containing protein [Ancylobacter sp.]